jgi:hypothetical protein
MKTDSYTTGGLGVASSNLAAPTNLPRAYPTYEIPAAMADPLLAHVGRAARCRGLRPPHKPRWTSGATNLRCNKPAADVFMLRATMI